MELFELSATLSAALIRRREVSPVELVEALARRIEALEPAIQAWETLDLEVALAAARRCEEEAGKGDTGPLHGVPIGVKDIFYTAGLRTGSGCSLYRDFVPAHDATAVARLRQAGAIVLGKTVTTQFAHLDPSRTRNPWNHARTPGGSSSGSAAAVAARMVSGALGTQTGGSILKPAAYCGVVGLKPTYGRVSRRGVTPASWSLDHVGVLVRSVEDAALLLQAMAGRDPLDPASSDAPVADYRRAAVRGDAAPRLGLVVEYLERAQPEVAAHGRDVAARLERAGARLQEVRLPVPNSEILAVRNLISMVETAALHARTLRSHPDAYLPRARADADLGQLVPGAAYLQAQRLRRRLRPRIRQMLDGVDCLLMPTVPNVAPDPSTTGDGSFQRPWSLVGFPSISLPSGLSRDRLPLAVQLVALPFREDTLLGVAAWCEAVLGPMPAPS